MKRKQTLFIGLILLVLSVNKADAYLDPGTGSMLFQGLIAGVMVVGTTVGIYWKKVVSFFSRKKGESNLKEKNES